MQCNGKQKSTTHFYHYYKIIILMHKMCTLYTSPAVDNPLNPLIFCQTIIYFVFFCFSIFPIYLYWTNVYMNVHCTPRKLIKFCYSYECVCLFNQNQCQIGNIKYIRDNICKSKLDDRILRQELYITLSSDWKKGLLLIPVD